jgi:hypothetical protein
MDPLIELKKATPPFLGMFVVVCLALSPRVQAVVPPPDGGYPNFTTAEGTNALKNLTTGSANTAVGWFSLFSDTDGSFNTGMGAGTLLFNVGDQSTGQGVRNTALGAVALFFNTTGSENTATGLQALFSNTTGSNNTASGRQALFSNTTGSQNTATGVLALSDNIDASFNTATGVQALSSNTTGSNNTASGYQALNFNINGALNTATGVQALNDNINGNLNTATGYAALSHNIQGTTNTATGVQALSSNTTGSNNTASGYQAGFNITGNRNVCIGAGVSGAAGVDDTTWIRNVYASVASGRAVYVNSDNKIGTLSSSVRYKEEIKPMDKASETLFALKPVTFRYKKAVDSSQALSFGLIAEEVAQVNPVLITRDEHGKPQTVRYEMVNAMLLNEFLKEHRKNEEQEATIAKLKHDFQSKLAQQQKQIEALTAGLQKVSAQLEASNPAPQVVENNR